MQAKYRSLYTKTNELSELSPPILADWADQGVTFRLDESGERVIPTVTDGRRLTPEERAEMVAQKAAIKWALEEEWRAKQVWAPYAPYQPVTELPSYCETPGHEDITVYQFSAEGRAMCAECASAGTTAQQAVLPSLDTTEPSDATTSQRSASGAERYYA